ncbi:hypothetical protein GLOIN_2v1783140 [Rhizophagus irregularis DAOM 181602=DAOM 197198]|nr:hypothetical protein GLOIN_2v1783140 [Rhizophagus irregularis DAOM 181602=DAOM 197198]
MCISSVGKRKAGVRIKCQAIAKLRKKFAEIEGENECRTQGQNRRIGENSVDISAENAELKAELAKLRYDFDSSNLTRPQQPHHVTNMQNSCSVGEEVSEVTTVPQPDASDRSAYK